MQPQMLSIFNLSNDFLIRFSRSISLLFKIRFNLFLLIYILLMLQTSSIGLYSGEYRGVQAYLKPSSFILAIECWFLCTARLSYMSIILSKGFFLLISSRNILYFLTLSAFGKHMIASMPFSRDIAPMTAIGWQYMSPISTYVFYLSLDQSLLGKVFLVTSISSRYNSLNPNTRADYVSSLSCRISSYNRGRVRLVGILVILISFFLILLT